MKRCTFCDSEIPDAAVQCAHCGGPAERSTETPLAEAVPSPPPAEASPELQRAVVTGLLAYFSISMISFAIVAVLIVLVFLFIGIKIVSGP